MSSRKKFLCLDCRVDTGKIGEFYFVYSHIWHDAVGSYCGMLCIGCLESRIGRELDSRDFTSAYINSISFSPKSDRLLGRLTRV